MGEGARLRSHCIIMDINRRSPKWLPVPYCAIYGRSLPAILFPRGVPGGFRFGCSVSPCMARLILKLSKRRGIP
jgi:hypothetical protein